MHDFLLSSHLHEMQQLTLMLVMDAMCVRVYACLYMHITNVTYVCIRVHR
jgi:hypothetical protein